MIRVIIGQDLTESPVSVPTLLKLVRTVLWRWISVRAWARSSGMGSAAVRVCSPVWT